MCSLIYAHASMQSNIRGLFNKASFAAFLSSPQMLQGNRPVATPKNHLWTPQRRQFQVKVCFVSLFEFFSSHRHTERIWVGSR